MSIVLRTLLLLLCLAHPFGVFAQDAVVPKPLNILDLQPNWMETYREKLVDQEAMVRIFAGLEELKGELVDPAKANQVAGDLTRQKALVNSIQKLEKDPFVGPAFEWTPRLSYTLQEYLHFADERRNLKSMIKAKEEERLSMEGQLSDLRSLMIEGYELYQLPKNTPQKRFVHGVGLLLLGTETYYVEKRLERLVKEIHSLKHTESAMNGEWKKIDGKLDLSDLSQESIQTKLDALAAKEVRLLPALNFNDVKGDEALHNSKIALNESLLLLVQVMNKGVNEESVNQFEDLKKYVVSRKKLLKRWEEITYERINRSVTDGTLDSQKTSGVNGLSMEQLIDTQKTLQLLSINLEHVDLILGIVENKILEQGTFAEHLTYYFTYSQEKFKSTFYDWFYFQLFEVGGVPITPMALFKAVIIFLLTLWIARITRRWLRAFLKSRLKMDETNVYLLSRITYYLIIVFGVLIAFSSIGLNVQNIAIVLGALGVGIGFGLQNMVNNFLSGLTILFGRNVKIGDLIELQNGDFGRITGINMQNSTLRAFNGKDLIVPNSMIVGNRVSNWTKQDPFVRLHIPFNIAYGSDPDLVKKIVIEAAKEVPSTAGAKQGMPDPDVRLLGFGESALEFELFVWSNIRRYGGRRRLKSGYFFAIEKAISQSPFNFPFPQRDIHIKTPAHKNSGV